MNIKKFILTVIFLTVSFCCLTEVWARKIIDYSGLQSQYGKDLKSAPFYLRQKFLNDTGKSWPKASLEERGQFITAYFDQKKKEVKQSQKRQNLKLKAQMLTQKQKNMALRNEQRSARQKQKTKLMVLKHEQQKAKAFNKLVRQQNKKMQKMRKR